MPVPQNLQDALAKIDTDTTTLGGVVSDLRAQIHTGMTQQEVDAVTATLAGVATRLEGIAADPNNPVPNTPMPSFKKKP